MRNIRKNKVRRIRKLQSQGLRQCDIVRITGYSTVTVHHVRKGTYNEIEDVGIGPDSKLGNNKIVRIRLKKFSRNSYVRGSDTGHLPQDALECRCGELVGHDPTSGVTSEDICIAHEEAFSQMYMWGEKYDLLCKGLDKKDREILMGVMNGESARQIVKVCHVGHKRVERLQAQLI